VSVQEAGTESGDAGLEWLGMMSNGGTGGVVDDGGRDGRRS